MLKSILRKLKSFHFKEKKYEIVVLPEYSNAKFKISCNIEKFRITNYGGEKEALNYFLTLVKRAKIVFDIGASVGLLTVVSAKLYKSNKIFAFEPDVETFHRLKENIVLNNLKNVEAYPLACSDNKGFVELFTNGLNGYAPSLKEQKSRKGAPEESIKIPSNSLDNLIFSKVIPIPDLIKIDIEGAEILCLRGAEKLLRGDFGKRPNDIFIEVHPSFLKNFNSSSDEVVNLLISNYYKIIQSQENHNQIHYHFSLT